MNRHQAKELLPIIQAFAEGKEIESRVKDKWYRVLEICNETNPKDYRIKPEQKYRPFKDKEECWQEMLKHQPFGWIKSYYGQFIITVIKDSKATIGRNDNFLDYDYILKNYTFADDTPFGIKE